MLMLTLEAVTGHFYLYSITGFSCMVLFSSKTLLKLDHATDPMVLASLTLLVEADLRMNNKSASGMEDVK